MAIDGILICDNEICSCTERFDYRFKDWTRLPNGADICPTCSERAERGEIQLKLKKATQQAQDSLIHIRK